MESTTPPNPTGFNRKPKRKFKRIACNGKSTKDRKATGLQSADNYYAQWMAGTFFLMCAAELLSPVFIDRNGNIPTEK